jgi:hypothetical protein
MAKSLNWSDSDVTPMHVKRTLWLCPKCSELKPTRHENVVRHVNRKHGAVGEPISVTTGQTRNLMLAFGLLSPIRKSFKKPVSSQDVYDNPSTILDYKQIHPTGSSDLTDKAIICSLVGWAKETQKNMQTIMLQNFTIINILNDIMMYVQKPKQSSNGNNVSGNFA